MRILLLLCFFIYASGSCCAQGVRIFAYTADPQKARISLFWKDADGKILSSFNNLKALLLKEHRELLFAMNGGMYQEDQSALGLFVQGGTVMHPLNLATGSGNFYLKPNGVFYLTKSRKAGIVPSAKMKGIVAEYATQSGPMLVTDGAINPLFTRGSKNLNIRNGVGILPDGRVVFAIAESPVSLYDFAAWFKARGCASALYLDGAISGMWSSTGASGNGSGFGVMIGITAP